MDATTVIAYIFGLFLLYMLAYLLFVPLKIIMKLIYNAFVGGLLLWLVNLVGTYFGFGVPINPITALVAGFLGVPGVLLVMALKYFLV